MTARSRDRRVYLGSHPLLFALLAITRRRPARRLGGTVLVHDRDAYVAALTRIPLDRTAEGTTGGAAGRLTGAGALFDQDGDAHRRTRRSTADVFGTAGATRLRPLWTELLERRLAPLATGASVDLVPVAAELAGATAAALLGLPVDPMELADAAREAGATAARAHLPGLRRRRAERAAQDAAALLTALVTPPPHPETVAAFPGAPGADRSGEAADQSGLATMLAAAAITTTVAALPRAAAWAADANLWAYVDDHLDALADELLRVTAPTPLLPRVAAAPGDLFTTRPAGIAAGRPEERHPAGGHPEDRPSQGRTAAGQTAAGRLGGRGGCPVRTGDRLLLVARHAVDAHRADPDPMDPATAQVAQLVFGAGPHACPGARLARMQMADTLAALAPYRPVVVSARADRHAALPSWRSLVVRATR